MANSKEMTFSEALRIHPGHQPDFVADDQPIAIGYGADAILITEDDLNKLREGKVMILDSQGEYSVLLKLQGT